MNVGIQPDRWKNLCFFKGESRLNWKTRGPIRASLAMVFLIKRFKNNALSPLSWIGRLCQAAPLNLDRLSAKEKVGRFRTANSPYMSKS